MSSTYLGQVATAVQRPCEALGRSPDLRAKTLNQGTVRICCKDPRVGIGLGFIGPIYTAESLDTGSFAFGRRAEPSLHSATPPCNTCPVSAAISGNHNDNPPLHWTLSAVICWISHSALLVRLSCLCFMAFLVTLDVFLMCRLQVLIPPSTTEKNVTAEACPGIIYTWTVQCIG